MLLMAKGGLRFDQEEPKIGFWLIICNPREVFRHPMFGRSG
jgi:hypothetical protein